nr:HRDC domain-containing protein [uncultured Niameybacter sp.]
MGLFDKMNEPIFLKEGKGLEAQLLQLKALEPMLNEEGQAIIRQDIKCLEYGLIGEQNIAFELKHSHMPMYILQDIYLEDGDLSAQIDFLVVTRKICFVIECKNLYGDIEINQAGDFIRTMTFGSKKIKEGIYSPITQNQRHLELIKKLRSDRKKNFIMKLAMEKSFDTFNKSIVVLANPKTVLHTKYAKKDIKDQVIRADQLVRYIKETCKASKELESSDTELEKWANSYLTLHKEVVKDYTEKYKPYLVANLEAREKMLKEEEGFKVGEAEVGSVAEPLEDITQTEIYKALKQYRLEKSREEGIKPYFIYNNAQLEDLIMKGPKNLEELQEVNGFGEVKVQKYGEDILEIILKYKE